VIESNAPVHPVPLAIYESEARGHQYRTPLTAPAAPHRRTLRTPPSAGRRDERLPDGRSAQFTRFAEDHTLAEGTQERPGSGNAPFSRLINDSRAASERKR